jgi:hypothetical protein
MDKKLRAEVLAEVQSAIEYGFENQEEILENALDMFYHEEIDEEWLRENIEKAYKKRLAQEQAWPSITDFDKLATAFDALGKDHILALHRAGVTRQDAMSDAWELHEAVQAQGLNPLGYCYYHAQDIGRAIETKRLLIGFADYDEEEKRKQEVGKRIVKRLEEQGIEVVWNGDPETRIEVRNFSWQKRHDQTDAGYERAIRNLNSL